MAKVDVPDYYKYTADNIGGIIQLIKDAAQEGGDNFRAHYAIDKCLTSDEFQGTLEYLAAVKGLSDGDSFNDVVQHLTNRHLIRNQLGGLWFPFRRLLPDGSTFRNRMIALLIKAKDVSYADLYEVYPEMKKADHAAATEVSESSTKQ